MKKSLFMMIFAAMIAGAFLPPVSAGDIGDYIDTYKPIYFIAYGNKQLIQSQEFSQPWAKFQISFKVPVAKQHTPYGKLYIGYTQKTFWALKDSSGTMRGTNYIPELFYDIPINYGPLMRITPGYIHVSTGEGDIVTPRPLSGPAYVKGETRTEIKQASNGWDRIQFPTHLAFFDSLITVCLRPWIVLATERNTYGIRDVTGFAKDSRIFGKDFGADAIVGLNALGGRHTVTIGRSSLDFESLLNMEFFNFKAFLQYHTGKYETLFAQTVDGKNLDWSSETQAGGAGLAFVW